MLRRSVLLAFAALVGVGYPTTAQETPPDRSGFTLALNLGAGVQRDQALATTETGLALDFAIGGFVSDDLAVMYRLSSTSVSHGAFDQVSQVSGTSGVAVQYWVDDRLHLVGGVGVGFWDIGLDEDELDATGLGLILGAGYSVWQNSGHDFSIGLEYAPAFTEPETVHNLGIVFGWQKF